MASEVGHLEPTTRITGYVWSEIPIAHFNSLFERGSQYANPVAAVPSLHAAYTLLIVLFLWRSAGRFRPLLALYPVAMAFALVYFAEHYFSDILLGWIYAVFAFCAVNAVADLLAQRSAQPEPAT
jgi:membrane-associated phospholipid phosphatase